MKNKNILIHILFILIYMFIVACSTKEYKILVPKAINNNFMNQNIETNKLLARYFLVWDQEKVSYSKIEASWGLNYKYKKVYLENHITADQKWFEKQENNANFEEYNTLLKKAITLKNTNIRVLPTISPMFYNPTKPGEGFPFDYNQNSLLKINTPLIVSHLSKDKAWAYVQSSTVGGWVQINNIAFVDDDFIDHFKTNDYYVAIKEKFPIYDNIFVEYIKLATIFPKKDNKFLIAKADNMQNAVISYININNDKISHLPLKYNKQNRYLVAKALLGEPYGWGGLLNNRDCSSFTQDFFIPFGKLLSRNSKAQAKNGKYHDISTLNDEEKKEYIIKNAIPYSTLIYLKGHIMLYVGAKNNEPFVMHNMWSVRLNNSKGEEYRHIVGKTSVTTLEVGKDLKDYNPKKSILRKVRGIVIL